MIYLHKRDQAGNFVIELVVAEGRCVEIQQVVELGHHLRGKGQMSPILVCREPRNTFQKIQKIAELSELVHHLSGKIANVVFSSVSGASRHFPKNCYFEIKQVVELEHHLREKGKCRLF